MTTFVEDTRTTISGSHGTDTATLLRERARSLAHVIRMGAEQSEADRRVTGTVIDALDAAGMFRIAVPKRLGGYELPIHDFVDINAIIASADGGTGWVTTLTSVCAWMTGLFPEQAQRDVWEADPSARVCGVLTPTSTAVREDGGLRVTGTWTFASGSLHAQWALLGVPVVDETGAQVDQGLALVPMGDLRLEDTWYVAGMRSSGSNTLIAEGAFVPDHRILSISRAIDGGYATEHTDEALYRSAFIPTLAIVLAGPMTGIAQGALDLVLASLAKGKGISYTFYEHAVDAGSTQISIAEAAELVDTAVLHMHRCAEAIDAAAAAGTYPGLLERARARMDTGYVARRTREAVDLLMSVQGAGGFAQASPLQRMWRDLNTCSRHAVVGPGISSELYGRALLGITEQVTPLI